MCVLFVDTERLAMKKCTVCLQEKNFSDFYKRATSPDKISPHCKVCDNLKRQKYRKDNPIKNQRSSRNRNLLSKYGITIEDYDKMFESQGRMCGICKTEENYSGHTGPRKDWSFSVDHCHTTGHIRGLLCNDCNRALGLFRDDPDRLVAALNWLQTKDVA